MDRLLQLAKTLRDPQKGCPWDKAQTFSSFKQCLIEEAREVVAAIEAEDYDNLCEELGDTLFNLVFLINLAEEQKLFDMEQVIDRVHRKLIRRHPHVFGDKQATTVEDAWRFFNEIKEQEKQQK